MKNKIEIRKTCNRGHVFYKSSNCPVCPTCWSGYYRKKAQSDFPNIGAPALRALQGARITKLSQLSKYTELDLLALHGVGPKAIKILYSALKLKGLTMKKISDNK